MVPKLDFFQYYVIFVKCFYYKKNQDLKDRGSNLFYLFVKINKLKIFISLYYHNKMYLVIKSLETFVKIL